MRELHPRPAAPGRCHHFGLLRQRTDVRPASTWTTPTVRCCATPQRHCRQPHQQPVSGQRPVRLCSRQLSDPTRHGQRRGRGHLVLRSDHEGRLSFTGRMALESGWLAQRGHRPGPPPVVAAPPVPRRHGAGGRGGQPLPGAGPTLCCSTPGHPLLARRLARGAVAGRAAVAFIIWAMTGRWSAASAPLKMAVFSCFDCIKAMISGI